MKYGVLADPGLNKDVITGEIYRNAYLEKLKFLIGKEKDTPLPIILDRFFSAPELAGGTPRHIAESLYKEIDGIKSPVLKISEWIDKRDEENIEKFIYPESIEKFDNDPISDDLLTEEFNKLTLEEFFKML